MTNPLEEDDTTTSWDTEGMVLELSCVILHDKLIDIGNYLRFDTHVSLI